jgi:hypothetical protein
MTKDQIEYLLTTYYMGGSRWYSRRYWAYELGRVVDPLVASGHLDTTTGNGSVVELTVKGRKFAEKEAALRAIAR